MEERTVYPDNPKGHSRDHLVERAVDIRWEKHTSHEKVAAEIEISEALLKDVSGSPEYYEAVREKMTTVRKPKQCLTWINSYARMAKRFGARMGLERETAQGMIDEVTAELEAIIRSENGPSPQEEATTPVAESPASEPVDSMPEPVQETDTRSDSEEAEPVEYAPNFEEETNMQG